MVWYEVWYEVTEKSWLLSCTG